MNNVLIVDDEVLVYNFLCTLIPWEAHGFTICGEAGNGRIALEMISVHQPDIILLDISMPTMDGIMLSNYIREHELPIQIIILSSYQDYDYVRTTMKNGAVDYLLKHEINGDILLQALQRAREAIKQGSGRPAGTADERATQLLRQETAKKLLLGVETAADPILVDLLAHCAVIVLQIDQYELAGKRFTDDTRFRLGQSIMNLGSLTLGSHPGLMISMAEGKYALLFDLGQCRNDSQIRQDVHELMRALESAFERYLNLSFTWGFRAPCSSCQELARSYQAVCAQLDGNDLEKMARNGKSVPFPRLQTSQEKRMLTALDAFSLNETNTVLREIFTSLSSFEDNPAAIKLLAGELITIATKICQREGIDFDLLCDINALHFNRLESTQSWISMLYQNLVAAIKSARRESTYQPYIAQAIQYIHENYMNDILLTTVAEQLHISPAYLSHRFKEETGQSFVDYLRNCRIKTAISLIEEGRYSLSVISQRVGFKNYNYFFQVFKEVTGKTPRYYIH